MKQTVAHKKLSSLQGILLVLGLVAAILLLNLIIEIAGRFIGPGAATACFWGIGILIVLWVYRTYVVAYQYELDEDELRLSRRYGKRERPIETIYLRSLQFVGSREEAQKRYPGAKKVSALHSRCSIPVTAVVYRDSEGTRIALIQADDALKEKLAARRKGK